MAVDVADDADVVADAADLVVVVVVVDFVDDGEVVVVVKKKKMKMMEVAAVEVVVAAVAAVVVVVLERCQAYRPSANAASCRHSRYGTSVAVPGVVHRMDS